VETTVSSKGQIVLPASIRRLDDVRPGQRFVVERLDRGEYRLRRTTGPANEGLVNLLLACPVKGWFEPLSRAETTGDVSGPDLE
jgi:AbrB family looped-hinge helix DNA binding protein